MNPGRRVRDLPVVLRSPKQIVWRFIDLARMTALLVESVLWRRSIIGDARCIVSLTSFGSRINDVTFTLQTIRRGTVRPSRIILWLDDEQIVRKPPRFLRRLQRAGLEIRACADLGPYKKQYPYIESTETHELPLVTADDDVFYPRDWLSTLMAGYAAAPDVVNCGRARMMTFDTAGELEPYASWRFVRSAQPGPHVFPTGVSGTVYPPALLYVLRDRGLQFLVDAPRADDVWVHSTAIREGMECRQVSAKPLLLRRIPGSDGNSLMTTNVDGGENDVQIRRCYTEQDRELIRGSASS